MGDGQHGAGEALEELLEPGHRLGVEVVGRLVQQQQVGRREQQPAERDAAPLAAGQRRHVGVGRRAAQRVHRDVEVAVEVPGVEPLDPVLHLALLLEQRRHLLVGHRLGEPLRELVERVEQVALLGDAVLDVAAHVLRRVELRLLRQQADRRAGRQLGAAAGRLVQAGHDPQQRRLARAVRPEHADLGARVERQRDVAEHLPLGPVELLDPVHRVDVLRAHGARKDRRVVRCAASGASAPPAAPHQAEHGRCGEPDGARQDADDDAAAQVVHAEQPGPAIRNTGISTITRSRMNSGGPAAHQ